MRRRRRLLSGLGLVAAATIVVVGVGAIRAMDPEPHLAVLDELEFSASWELAHTEIVQNMLLGSRVERYYFVDADPADVVSPVTDVLTRAGFVLDVRRAPRDWCDNRPLPAPSDIYCPIKLIPICQPNGPAGPVTCYITASRGDECLQVVAFDRGERATYYRGMEPYQVGDPARIVVRVSDYYPGAGVCQRQPS